LLALGQWQYMAYHTSSPGVALGNPKLNGSYLMLRLRGAGFLWGRGATCGPVSLTNEPWVGPVPPWVAVLGCFECPSRALLACMCQPAPCLTNWKCREVMGTPCWGGCLFVIQRYFELGLKWERFNKSPFFL